MSDGKPNKIALVYLRDSVTSETGLEIVVVLDGGFCMTHPFSFGARNDMLCEIAECIGREKR